MKPRFDRIPSKAQDCYESYALLMVLGLAIRRSLSIPVCMGGVRQLTLATRGFSRVRREFSVSAFGRTPKPREKRAFRAGHYKDLTETRNRARKVSGSQGTADFRAFPEERSLIAGHQPAGV